MRNLLCTSLAVLLATVLARPAEPRAEEGPGRWPPPDTAAAARTCVFTDQVDSRRMEAFLTAWWAAHGQGELTDWSVSIGRSRAQVSFLREGRPPVRFRLELPDDCRGTVQVHAEESSPGPAVSERATEKLAAGFPLERTMVWKGEAEEGSGRTRLLLTLLIVALAVALRLFHGRDNLLGRISAGLGRFLMSPLKRPDPLVLPLALVLVGLAAWPLLFEPLARDAIIFRYFCALGGLLEDPGHPFFPFLVMRLGSFLSRDPWALRLGLLLFLAAQTLLLTHLAGRLDGRLAGLAAAAWLAMEVRRRYGLVDLSDWDMAGTFLVAYCWWLMRWVDDDPTPPPPRAWALLGLLLVMGCISSYLMLVPSGLLIGVLAFRAWRRQLPRLPVLLVGAALLLLALPQRVYMLYGRTRENWQGPADTMELLSQVWQALPGTRTLVMIVPGILGAWWLWRNRRQALAQFMAATLAGVLATLVIFRPLVSMNGFYFGLCTPLILWAGAAGCTELLRRLARPPGPLKEGWLRTAVGAALPGLALLGLSLTFTWPGKMVGSVSGAPQMYGFVAAALEEPLPVLSDAWVLELAILHESVRTGREEPDHQVFRTIVRQKTHEKDGLETGELDQARRVFPFHTGTCRPRYGWNHIKGDFYLALAGFEFGPEEGLCRRLVEQHCRTLFAQRAEPAGSAAGDRTIPRRYFLCRRSGFGRTP